MGSARVYYFAVDDFWRREKRLDYLREAREAVGVPWRELQPDTQNRWLSDQSTSEFSSLLRLGQRQFEERVFDRYTRGVATARDAWCFNFNKESLTSNVKKTIGFYNSEILRWRSGKQQDNVDTFVTYDDKQISWSRDLKADLVRERFVEFSQVHIREAVYRPFTVSFVYLDRILNEEVYGFPWAMPEPNSRNVFMCVVNEAQMPFSVQITNRVPCLHYGGRQTQCFPFYSYDEDGSNRRENITDWTLNEFRTQYKDQKIGKWDIFHYVYGVLHSPEYRERYAANLKRELPRIPFAPDCRGFAKAGERLAELHVNYEKQPEYPLERVENPKEKLNLRVEKMRLSKDKSLLTYNNFLTLKGIPPETYEYRLGNRSALEWIVDQYQVSTDKRSGITNDPNREDDPEYILRLIGQVVYVSLETVKIVNALPSLGISQGTGASA